VKVARWPAKDFMRTHWPKGGDFGADYGWLPTSDGYYCPSHAPQARARFRKPYETRATLSGRRPPVRL
jgi:hypothetical protein